MRLISGEKPRFEAFARIQRPEAALDPSWLAQVQHRLLNSRPSSTTLHVFFGSSDSLRLSWSRQC